MSGLSVLKVLATVVDLFKMFNSTIGTFHHTTVHALQRSSLAGLRWLSANFPFFVFEIINMVCPVRRVCFGLSHGNRRSLSC